VSVLVSKVTGERTVNMSPHVPTLLTTKFARTMVLLSDSLANHAVVSVHGAIVATTAKLQTFAFMDMVKMNVKMEDIRLGHMATASAFVSSDSEETTASFLCSVRLIRSMALFA